MGDIKNILELSCKDDDRRLNNDLHDQLVYFRDLRKVIVWNHAPKMDIRDFADDT